MIVGAGDAAITGSETTHASVLGASEAAVAALLEKGGLSDTTASLSLSRNRVV
jgi:hypothetical protein